MSDTDISNEAVQKATDKDWDEWYSILDDESSTSKSHKEIAAWLSEHYDISGWWVQMITVQYERECRMRKVYEKKDGFEASKSKTIHVTLNKLYKAWADDNQRSKWLDDPQITIRTSNKNKSMRITGYNNTNVEVYFSAKGDSKSQVAIQHNKLPNQKEVGNRKKYWQKQIDQLVDFLDA